ncbi:UDP-N-acetylmuramate dehydrogenase [Polynucleobacter sp.]|uniref:UDP-N-acetylmuramate dehydrogenase n=1 Tax=Polynucleobacter sp. TaxID=2029855 RepID=UPI002736BB26|nr:UDP-N-acetylmuramate dehydrogenase [Polynucleobacter sp.]MDP3122667.1 UDP-N-acetylmuramate dehydrogenase [Polynucleobacter sp.]
MNSAPNAPSSPKTAPPSVIPVMLPDVSLRARNSFGFDVLAEQAYSITDAEHIGAVMEAIKAANLPWRVLGGGSNVVLPPTLSGVTLLMDIAGQAITQQDERGAVVSVGAGVNWHDFVIWTLDHSLPGLENLALIPGTVGAAPIQNIGAYGVEVGEYIQSIEAYDCHSKTLVNLLASECAFTYRNSIFKAHPNRYIITRVHFYLPAAWSPRLRYADLAAAFVNRHVPTAEEVMVAVCKIRNRKLPDPKLIGNAGSFFQNPIVEKAQYLALLKQFPELVSYPEGNEQEGKRKLAAGWMIDHCGFKGLRAGAVGVYQHQALVLVNHGGGSADSVLALAKTIQDKVQDTFGVTLAIEPIRY